MNLGLSYFILDINGFTSWTRRVKRLAVSRDVLADTYRAYDDWARANGDRIKKQADGLIAVRELKPPTIASP